MDKTIRIDLARTVKPNQVEGNIFVVDLFEIRYQCYTVELPWKENKKNVSCIPDGSYKASKYYSDKYNCECIMLENVPNRKYIAIHPGNFAGSENPNTGESDIRGCILPGRDLGDLNSDGIREVLYSRDALKDLLKHLPDSFEVNIYTQHGKPCVLDYDKIA